MSAEEPLVFVIAAEDRGHYEAVTRLTDRKIAEDVPWTADILEYVRVWLGDENKAWISITSAKTAIRELGAKLHGGFGASAGRPEARRYRALLMWWMQRCRAGERIDAAFLVRDLDRRDERIEATRPILDAPWPFKVVAAWCVPEVEGWAVACFSPADAEEQLRLERLRRRLSFCPVSHPEKLTSATLSPERDAKAIAQELFGDSAQRREAWLGLPFETLRSRGATSGLAHFLDQVETKIVPLFRQSPERPQ